MALHDTSHANLLDRLGCYDGSVIELSTEEATPVNAKLGTYSKTSNGEDQIHFHRTIIFLKKCTFDLSRGSSTDLCPARFIDPSR